MKSNDIKVYLCIIFLSILFVTVFSDTTSPLYKCSYCTDSSAYYIFGKSVVMGKIPYIDIWELKGPAIFYIEALGYWLTKSMFGIFIMQVLLMAITYFFLYKTYQMEFSPKIAALLVFFSCFSLSLNYQGGNLIEEYTLPLLSCSIWLIYSFSKTPVCNGLPCHNPYYSILYGFVLGFSLMTRLTDGLGICGAVLVIACYLIIYRQWMNLMNNIICFVIGFVIIVLPFCMYFYSKDALSEMWYGTFVFNLSYAKESSMGGIHDIPTMKKFLLAFVNSYTLLVVGLMMLIINKKRWVAAFMWITMGGGLFVWYVNSNGFAHYGMLAFPYSCLVINELSQLTKMTLFRNLLAKGVLLIYTMFVCYYGLWAFYSQYVRYNTPYKNYELFRRFLSKIPSSDRDSFVAYNVDSPIYHIGDLLPCYKYPGSQDWLMGMNAGHYKRVYNEFATCRAKWILVNENSNTGIVKITPILSAYYIAVCNKEQYTLYKLKNSCNNHSQKNVE